mgnify:CR=1 FL=1
MPVLLKEVIEILNPQPGEFFIDGTLGSGGHAVKIFEKILPGGKLLGLDLDGNNLKIAESKILASIKYPVSSIKQNLILIHGNYADLPEILEWEKLGKADGLLLDLGFSSEHLQSGRGFSFLKNEPLDMRYNTKTKMTAGEVVSSFSEKDLAEIFYKYGEERYSRQIAKKIITERKRKSIKTTFDLVEIIGGGKDRIHPATRVFQALRIYVNDELGNLEKLLKNIDKIIKGRVAIISFHSLEDRLVKNYFRDLKNQGKAQILTKKPIRPSGEEIQINPRSRSAKLRVLYLVASSK